MARAIRPVGFACFWWAASSAVLAQEDKGVTAVIADPLDKQALTAMVRRAEPEVIIHQLTALSSVGNFKKFDQEFALTNRFRTDVTDTLLAAARTIGTRRFIAQSYCGWPYAKKGGPVKTEEDPLDPKPPEGFTKTLAAIRYLEDTVCKTTFLEGLALRYECSMARHRDRKGGVILKMTAARFPIIGGGAILVVHSSPRRFARHSCGISRGAPGIYKSSD